MAGWHGDPDAFGEAAAILLGDLCLTWSDQLLAGSGLPGLALSRGAADYDAMRTELMAGQYLDLLGQVSGEASVDRAMRVARFKTAKYTVEQPLLLGASMAGAGPDVRAAYSAYGVPLGEAFQLRDDVLGVFGDPGTTGKPAGDDLREGKRTVLVATAMDRAGTADTARIRRWLGDPGLDGAELAALRGIIVDTGALDEVEGMVAELTARALDALAGAAIEPEAADVLAELAIAATARLR
jgi:geranylgeranyl diphosphate synthase type I